MRPNSVQAENATLPSQDPQLGLAFCILGRAESILLARGAGFDFAVVDMEHGPLGLDQLGQMAAVGRALHMPVYGRVTGPRSPDLARVLDCGATGVIIPHVDSVEDARHIAAQCRFAPIGQRALPGPLPLADYRLAAAAELCAAAETEVQLFAMIESAAGLSAVTGIAATAGISGLIIGTNDLADGLGLRGQPEHPAVLDAFRVIAQAARAQGCRFGIMGLPPALWRSHGKDLGADLIVLTNDTNLIHEAGQAQLTAARARLA
ncbi:HpcH/HpaI aldolase family protein [Phaeovulum sp. W22_SRMD_FR3]|uniref:HpcH/HpaI aldolase family protein n=1 Tax=Phaeovulum sp. W22_SRMD_FR3 TaxID=3240274 RepID=UPI003F9BEC0A